MTLSGSDWIAADLAAALEGPGSSSVVYGAVKTRGMLDKGEVVQADGSGEYVRLQRRMVTVRAAVFPAAPTTNATLTIDGDTYRVRGVRPQDDGLVWEIDLVEV